MRDVKLFVIGDSHADFWKGSDQQNVYDRIPGIRTLRIHAATAYALLNDQSRSQARTIALNGAREAARDGFQGWIMLNFGANDCGTWIWRHVPRLTLLESVGIVVERYIQFIHEMRTIYPKIAVFAPHAAAKNPDMGTETERNLAVLLFGSLTKERLRAYNIPVISITRAMIDSDGRSIPHLFQADRIHQTQALMPLALHRVNQVLGLHLGSDDPLFMEGSCIEEFLSIDYCELFDRHWIRYRLMHGSEYIKELLITSEILAELGALDITVSTDSLHFTGLPTGVPNPSLAHLGRQSIPIDCHAREILISSQARAIKAHEIVMYRYSSHPSRHIPYSREVLFALHDDLMQSERRRIACETFDGNSHANGTGISTT
jgi:hypothetical protein